MSARCQCGAVFDDYGLAREHYWDNYDEGGGAHHSWTIPASWLDGRPWAGAFALFGGEGRDHDERRTADYHAGRATL